MSSNIFDVDLNFCFVTFPNTSTDPWWAFYPRLTFCPHLTPCCSICFLQPCSISHAHHDHETGWTLDLATQTRQLFDIRLVLPFIFSAIKDFFLSLFFVGVTIVRQGNFESKFLCPNSTDLWLKTLLNTFVFVIFLHLVLIVLSVFTACFNKSTYLDCSILL